MTYAVRIIHNQETFFGYRNLKGEWTPSLSTPKGSTSFLTESGAWRAIMKSDSSLASASGSACWYDLLQKKGYEVNVVSVSQAEEIVQIEEVKLIAKLDLDILAIQSQLMNLQAQRDLINGNKKQRSLKAQVYINRHIVGVNKKATTADNSIDDAAISINTSLGVIYAKQIEFTGGCTLVQDANKARCSGATIWIEAAFESLVIDGKTADRAMFKKGKKMTVKELIKALTMCHSDAEVEFSVDFEGEGALVAVEHQVIGRREQINPHDVGCVYLHNTKNDFTHDEPLCSGNLFIT